MTKNVDKDAKLVTGMIENGSEIAGAMTGAAISLIGGPASIIGGATAGAALTAVLKKVGADVRRQVLSPREEVRIGATLAFAGSAIAEYLAAGKEPRDDFFGATSTKTKRRTVADELLEGVLTQARDAYEEKKLPFLGNLYANIAFHPEITPAQANHLIALAGQLTYRQLIGLYFARVQEKTGSILRDKDFRGDSAAQDRLGLNGISLVTELYDLYQRGLIHGSDGAAWISASDVNPGDMRTQGSGSVLMQLMGIKISDEDLQEFTSLFPKG